MSQSTFQFNAGNPFSVGPDGVHSATRLLPATVTSVTVNLLDPNGDWVNPANAGGNFIFGVEYTPDSGTTWRTLSSNGIGTPVGTHAIHGGLPTTGTSRSDGMAEAYGLPCRAFAVCTPLTITIGASATVTT